MLVREAQNVQNPALGAAAIWRFCCGYVESQATGDPPPLPVLFLTLSVVLHQATAELLQLHDRAMRWRVLSLQSVELATAGRLIHLTEAGTAVPLSRTRARGLPDEVKQILANAEKLGAWCGQLTLHEITTTLKVRL